MWKDLWQQLKKSKEQVSVDQAHLNNDRDGRYARGAQSVGRILYTGEPLGYRHFERKNEFDVCYLVFWRKEEYEENGQYMVFQLYYSPKSSAINELGYRSFQAAEICCYYDGEHPNPGRTLQSKDEAIECMKKKRGYYECK